MVDNLIRLFNPNDRDFSTNGIGVLSSAESCFVTEEKNGVFELEMVYPINGKHYQDIFLRNIIVTKSNPDSKPQPFRIYRISKPIDGRVTVNAAHISYDLSGYPVRPFTAKGIESTLKKLKSECVIQDCPFTFSSNIEDDDTYFSIVVPQSIRSLLGGSENSILEVFGKGELVYKFDGFNVELLTERGKDSGTVIRYGKNLTDIEQEENCSSVYSSVFPFWRSNNDGKIVTLPSGEETIDTGSGQDFAKILILDLSNEFSQEPDSQQLRDAVKKYLDENDITNPTLSMDISFEQLSRTSDYKDFAALEEVHLCDKVNVEYPKLGVSAKAECIKTVYDAIAGKYDKIELGEARSNLAYSFSQQSKIVDETVNSAVQKATGNLGGYVAIRNSKGGKEPDEILIMDADSYEKAEKIWRWNLNGLSYEDRTGANKSGVAINQNGEIVADFIRTGTLKAIEFESETKSDNEVPLFHVTPEGEITAVRGTIAGLTMEREEISKESTDGTDKETRTFSVLRIGSSKSSDENDFEIRVLEGSGNDSDIPHSTITIANLQSKTATFSKSITTNEINIGLLNVSQGLIKYNENNVIALNGNTSGSKLINATLSSNALSTEVSITLNPPLGASRIFKIRLHSTWGNWKEVDLEVKAGVGSYKATFPGAFWGYDDVCFVESGSSVLNFYETTKASLTLHCNIEPITNGSINLGSDEKRFGSIYTNKLYGENANANTIYLESSEIVTSDLNEKKDIAELAEKFDGLFEKLRPTSFKYKNGSSGRTHIGFVAQEVKDALDNLKISTDDFAPYCEWVKDDGSITSGLRYSEFVALNTYEIQKLKKRIKELEEMLNSTKSKGEIT